MKTKLFIIGMLLLSLVVLSGCLSEEGKLEKKCLEEIAEEYCKERDCVFDSVNYVNYFDKDFQILKGEWREYDLIHFTNKEIESCKNTVEI